MTMFVLLSIILFVTTATTTHIPTYVLTDGPASCASYPDDYFFNDNFTCQGYFYCANKTSQPLPGVCLKPYNFDEANQQCSHPDIHPCDLSFSVRGDYAKVAVNVHNEYRRRHGVPNVASFSSDINQFAQRWAQHLASTGQFYHSGGPYGENLYMAYGGSTDQSVIIANAIKSFYDEIKYYNWNNPAFSMKTGHFTQVVWKSSTEIGVGIATYNRRTIVCINYRPRGNVQGQFMQNVLPPKSSLDVVANRLYSNFNTYEDEPSITSVKQNVFPRKSILDGIFNRLKSNSKTGEEEPPITLVEQHVLPRKSSLDAIVNRLKSNFNTGEEEPSITLVKQNALDVFVNRFNTDEEESLFAMVL